MQKHLALAFFTDYNDQSAEENENENTGEVFEIPAELGDLSDSELEALRGHAVTNFDAIYGDGKGLDDEALEALAQLTEGLERIQGEQSVRGEAAAEREAKAAELVARIRPPEDTAEENSEEETPDEESIDGDVTGENAESAPEMIAASAKSNSINIATVRSRAGHRVLPKKAEPTYTGIKDLVRSSGEGTGFSPGEGVDWMGAASIVQRRLQLFSPAQYAAAQRSNTHLRQQMGVITINKPIPNELTITNNDPQHVEDVLRRAADESRLEGNSLVAAGGWCAPSETMYGLVELESRDGIFSLPEVGVTRGGFSRTLGPDFSEIYALSTGFKYTEEQDIAGTYGVDANGIGNDTAGSKPCVRIGCPEFQEFRLGVEGICVSAGLLQMRGYPELIARVMRGILVAHDHRVAGRNLGEVVQGSTAIVMPDQGGGALAPVLDAIEKQVEQYRYKHRISRATTFEAVFPYWVRGLIRTDLAKRNDVGYLAVSDAQIAAWFATRGIAPQFVYNWQDLPGNEATFTAWPQSVKFLLYPAGTWVRGMTDLISVDTLFDSTLLSTNDQIALFTEEGTMIVKMSHDSRVVTVPVCPNGAYAAAVDFECDQAFGTTTTTLATTTTTTVGG